MGGGAAMHAGPIAHSARFERSVLRRGPFAPRARNNGARHRPRSYGVRRFVGALGRVTCHPARARSAPGARERARIVKFDGDKSPRKSGDKPPHSTGLASSLWIAPAERSGDGALASPIPRDRQSQSGVALRLTPQSKFTGGTVATGAYSFSSRLAFS